MKSIILVQGYNHPILIASWTTNNFGDQEITFTHEALDGVKTYSYECFQEGDHSFCKKFLLSRWVNKHLVSVEVQS